MSIAQITEKSGVIYIRSHSTLPPEEHKQRASYLLRMFSGGHTPWFTTPQGGPEPTGYYSFENASSSSNTFGIYERNSSEDSHFSTNHDGHMNGRNTPICPDCQSQTSTIVIRQKGAFAWIIRMSLFLSIVLMCFAFSPYLPEDLKEYEYRCVSCNKVVEFYKGRRHN